MEGLAFKAAHPNEEGVGAGSAGHAGGFGVEEEEGGKRNFGETRIPGPGRDGSQRVGGDQGLAPVAVCGAKGLLGDKRFAAPGLPEAAGDDALDWDGRVRLGRSLIRAAAGGQVGGSHFHAKGFEFVCQGRFGQIHAPIVHHAFLSAESEVGK